MSISERIRELDKVGDLHRYLPKSRQNPKRRLYLTKEAQNDLRNPNSAMNVLGLRGYIESALNRWVLGQRVHADEKGKPRFLKLLCPPPPEIWEIRVTEPTVHARLFGRFAEPDTLILSRFHTRALLGKKGSAEWNTAMANCEASWSALFPKHAPFSAVSIHQYVTENCDDYAICQT